MNMKYLISSAVLVLGIMTSVSQAAPLPNGAGLGIEAGIGSAPNAPCSSGSCFGFEVAPGFLLWTDLAPGSDGGIIVGKDQQINEITDVVSWTGIAMYFATAPQNLTNCTTGADLNRYDDASCTGAACAGKTELLSWYMIFSGYCGSFGKSGSVTDWQFDSASARWRLDYRSVIDSGQFTGVNARFILRGGVYPGNPPAPPPHILTEPVSISGATGASILWKPVVTVASPYTLPTCAIVIPPANGIAAVAADCSSGTYQSAPGFEGIDSFVYEAKVPSSNYIYDAYYTSRSTVTASIVSTGPSDSCLAQYPVSQFTQTGKEGTLTIRFTGNIASHTNKEVKVCPGTTLSYAASSTKDVVKCKIKNNLTSANGALQIRDHLKCTDKPGGKDKLNIKVKSGVSK